MVPFRTPHTTGRAVICIRRLETRRGVGLMPLRNRTDGKISGRGDEGGGIMRGHLSTGLRNLRWQDLNRGGGKAASAICKRTRLKSSACAVPSISPCAACSTINSAAFYSWHRAKLMRTTARLFPARLLPGPDAPRPAASRRSSWRPPAAPLSRCAALPARLLRVSSLQKSSCSQRRA